MGSEIAEQLANDPERALLKELQGETGKLEAQLSVMRAQTTMQKLFVDTHVAVLANGTRKMFDATVGGKPAKLEIKSYYVNNTSDSTDLHNKNGARIFAYDAATDVILCDLFLSMPKGKESWDAEVARYPEGWKGHAGNPGIRWEKASGHFEDQASGTAIDGLFPEVVNVAMAMDQVASQILPS